MGKYSIFLGETGSSVRVKMSVIQTRVAWRPDDEKNTSCTLCCVDQFLTTSECKGQGTVALSSVMRADSSTARAVATKQGASQRMKHIHKRFLFFQDLVFRN